MAGFSQGELESLNPSHSSSDFGAIGSGNGGAYDSVGINYPTSDLSETIITVGDERSSGSVEVISHKKLTVMQLIILVYFWTCGGPFGIESAVGASGAAMTTITIIVICFFWAFPQALMSAELSLMMKVNGGNIVWVQTAFGDFVGFFNAGCFVASSLSSQALIVSLFGAYVQSSLNVTFTPTVIALIRLGFLVLCTIANIVGERWIARLSWVILVVIFVPFVIQMYLTAYLRIKIDYNNLLFFPGFNNIDWGTLISIGVWSLGGFDSVGSVAGNVEGKNTFLFGVLGAFPLNLLNYVIPIFAGYIISGNWSNWNSGYFTAIPSQYFPRDQWLSVMMVVASAISNFAQLTTAIASLSWSIWAMSKGRKDDIGQHRYLPYFLSWSWGRKQSSSYGRPLLAIFFTALLTYVVSFMNFNFVAKLYFLVRVANLTGEYATLIWLKYKEPYRPRPFSIPGGVAGAVLLTLPSFSIAVLALVTSIISDHTVALWGGVTLVGIVLLYPVKIFWIWVTHRTYEILANTVV